MGKTKKKKSGEVSNTIATNRRVRFEYEIITIYQAGMELKGTEVKSLRAGHVNMTEGYIRIREDMQAWLMNVHISEYDHGNIHNHEPLRWRRLLLHKTEIRRLYGQIKEQGLTIVPLRMYHLRGKLKLEIALVKGKKTHDKRETLKKRDAAMEIRRNMKNYE